MMHGKIDHQPPQMYGDEDDESLADTDLDDWSEIFKFETFVRPPTIEQLMELTGRRFSQRWIKYMYGRFKNECPTGKMRYSEFKVVFGIYLPDRVDDAYLRRMFFAIAGQKEEITFKDLLSIVTLLHASDMQKHAEWTMRLINPKTTNKVTLSDFHEFVKSVFVLTRRPPPKAPPGMPGMLDSSVSSPEAQPFGFVDFSPTTIHKTAYRRSYLVFHEIDISGKGYFTVQDLKDYFERKQKVVD